MARMILDLGSLPWRCGQVARQPFARRPLDDRAAVSRWLPGRVPGDVRADLLASGDIPSLDTPEEIAAAGWVDEYDWWYRTEIDAAEPGVSAVLEADGIDYFSSIWLDDRLLGTHQGMFARQTLALPPLESPGKHELAMRIWGATALPRLPDPPLRRAARKLVRGLKLTEEYFPDRMATPKAQFGFGWDFAPRVLSAGIWDDIRVVYCRGAYLADVQVSAEPLTVADDPTPVRWTVRLAINRFSDRGLSARIELRSLDGEAVPISQARFDLGASDDCVLTFDSPPVARWWPWDQGAPRLYCLAVHLFDEAGPVDEIETLVGVRTVRRQRFPNGQPWRFTINGRPVFLRGANWVPADILPGRVTPDDYARLIGQARAGGINFLRVWGGGIREKRAFWEQCDALGIMAMQEFPLACAFLDHYPREAPYLATLESEAGGMVRSLRNHPSLIAWCGGNEISPRRERLPLRTIERVLAREDPARPWLPASPSQGDIHQWDVWHGAAPWQSFARVAAPFVSEFGLQALPAADTVRELFPAGAPASLNDPAWAARKLQVGKLRHYAGDLAEEDLVSTIEATQRTQAAGLQTAIEACRMRREGSGARHPCGGVAFWQFNEPWPAVSWSVVDRAGRPKAAYEMLSHSYQPVLVAARFEWRMWRAGDRFDAALWLVNDTPEPLDACDVEALLDERMTFQREGVDAPAAGACRVGTFSVRLDGAPSRLRLTCWHRGVAAARNEYDLHVYLPPRQPRAAWLKRRLGDLLLQIG